MRKQSVAKFKVGDVLKVSAPTMAINLSIPDRNSEDKEMSDAPLKPVIEEVLLIGEEALIVSNVEYVKRTNEYLYQVLTELNTCGKVFSLAEDQLTLY